MTLHEAIEKVLKQYGQGMRPTEIAEKINQHKYYSRGDARPLKSGQISARVARYPRLLRKENGLVYSNELL